MPASLADRLVDVAQRNIYLLEAARRETQNPVIHYRLVEARLVAERLIAMAEDLRLAEKE